MGKFMTPSEIHFVSWERPSITKLAILTIARNTNSANYRLVVLDNGSSDAQQQMLIDLQNDGYIDELILWDQNHGLEVAREYLLRNCTSEFFICADNDCLPEPLDGTDWVSKLVDLMQKYEDYGAISCRTQVMIGTGNIFEDESLDITDFPHPGGSLRIMRTSVTESVGGWEGKPGRGAEERWICSQLRENGYKTGFATHIKTLHLFGLKDSDRWGYDKDWAPEVTGHSDISHPALENGDNIEDVKKYSGEELANAYLHYKI